MSVDRREAVAVATLTRNFQLGFTSLDLSRRKWAALSAAGKAALSGVANAETQLDFATAPKAQLLPPCDCSRVRVGLARIATRKRAARRAELIPVFDGLEAVVADLGSNVTRMRERLAQAGESLGAERAARAPLMHGESAEQLLSHASAMLLAFERELELRKAVAVEIAGGSTPPARPARWDATLRLYLSAWVLEPYLEHERLDLLLEGLDAEAYAPSPQGAGRSPRTPRS